MKTKKAKAPAPVIDVTYYKSPIGAMEIQAEGDQILRLTYLDDGRKIPKDMKPPKGVLKEFTKQLGEYFKGKRREFTVKFKVAGTDFQCQVWQKLMEIPYGRVVTYWDVDEVLGGTKAYRAVGNACGKNPLMLILPCHRVITSDGGLGGYAGEVWRKEWLLEHEADMVEKHGE